MIDLNKLPKDLSNLLSNSIIMPYWHLSIYIFHRNFYDSADKVLLLSACACLTISSTFITTIIFVGSEKTLFDREVLFASALAQVVLFSILLFFSYINFTVNTFTFCSEKDFIKIIFN